MSCNKTDDLWSMYDNISNTFDTNNSNTNDSNTNDSNIYTDKKLNTISENTNNDEENMFRL